MAANSAQSLSCFFPATGTAVGVQRRPLSLRIDLRHADLIQQFLARPDGTEEFAAIVQTVFSVLLRTYTGLNRVCFGLQEIGGKHSDATEDKNPAVFLDIEEDSSFEQLIQHIQTGSTINPSSNEILNYNTAILFRFSNANTTSSSRPATMADSCNLRLLVKLLKSGVSMFLEYRNSVISTERIRNIASTVDTILSTVLHHPSQLIRDSDFLSERNRVQIEKWNSVPLERVERTVHDTIFDTAQKVPQDQAVCSWDGEFTYRELDECATRVAAHLIELGVGAEVIVPLCFEKSKWNVVATLGTLISGGCFIPLDPSAPKERIQYLLSTVDAKVVICSPTYAESFDGIIENIVVIDNAFIESLQQPLQRPQARAESHNAAYIISTSGTTGQPKLPVIQHGNICTSVKAHYFGISMDITVPLRVLQFSAHSFDVSISEILSTLMCGGTICIPDEYTRLNNIAQAMNDMRVTHAQLTPTFARFLEPSMVPTLATIVLMGEAMSQADLETWSKINLLNGWGPCETSVYCTTRKGLTAISDIRNIGLPFKNYDTDERAVAHAWVVDPNNRHRRVPIGCTGEILLEGHIVGRGYFGDEEKTAQSFVTDVAWAKDRPFRGYLSGDLVIQQPDGTYNIVGRKDNQVKYHGQRIELLGIEHYINLDPSIGHNLVFLPKSGLLKERLVAVITLEEHTADDQALALFEGAEKDAIYSETELIRTRLAERLPAYMVPTVWIAISAFPRLSSRKLDRKQVLTWLTDMPAEVYQRAIAGVEEGAGCESESMTDMEASLRSVWAHVLNLPEQQVALERPFLSLGGDSISAMQVMGHCRKKGVTLGVQEILRSRSIRQLATTAKLSETLVEDTKEEIEKAFDLTPIQRYWFKLQEQGHGHGHFNQSFYLQVKRRTSAEAFRAAIHQLVSRHSMLRARFSFSAEYGWQQRITEDVEKSYRFLNQKVAGKTDVDSMIEDSQKCLDYTSGPLFAANLFQIGDGQQAFLTIHHLVVDLVSWRVILEELEDILKGEVLLPPALPFQKWAQLQIEHTQTLALDRVLPLVDVPALDWSYWGIEHFENTYGTAGNTSFSLDPSLTAPFLGPCHTALKTEPVEVLLASLIQAWSRVFTDRPLPAMFNEGHGREPWSSDIDISRTVGWFTTMNPVLVEPSDDSSTTVRKVKDFRRQIPGKGRLYFARRWLTDDGEERFATHWPAEITFNYLGQYQQLERSDALLQAMENMAGETREAGGTADVGHNAPRISLFEVSAVVFKGCIKFAFTFNKNMQHQDRIQQWVTECRRSITELIQTLPTLTPTPTLSDFPLLSLTEKRFQSMLQRLSKLSISPLDIEDAYPCSSMQEALLLSQSKDSATYACATLHELKLPRGRPDWARVTKAWKQVVKHHPILRTIFMENVGAEGLYDQVVLKQVDANVVHFDCTNEREALDKIQRQRSVSYDNTRYPAHRFTVCSTADGRVFCSLEISHAISDGHSMSLVFRNLSDAYMETLRGDGPLYSDYIHFVINQPKEASLDYWTSYLEGSETCDFPMLNDGQDVKDKDLVSIRLDFGNVSILDLHSFCNTNGITLSNVFHTAWALTLSSYVGTKDVTFGYLTTARDSQDIHRVQDMFGPAINTLVYRVNFSDSSRCLLDVLQGVQQDYLKAIPHRHIALAEVQHALGLSGANLFNTVLSYRRLPPATPVNDTDLQFVELAPIYDPTEYPVSLNIEISDDAAAVDLDYWTDYLSAGQAANVASTFIRAIENIVYNASHSLSSLDHLSGKHLQQIQQWNFMPETLHECVHHRFESWVASQPDAPAVRGFDGDYTYAQLDSVTDRLAHYLVELGVGPEVFVPTCFDKSSFAVVAMLAVLKAGGAAVPLDANHPKPALESRIEDTQAQVILTTAERAEMFEDVVPDVIVVDSVLLDDIPDVDGPPCTTVRPNNPAFVIFTSGSTGRPKGVILEHAAMVTSADAHGTNLGFGPGTRVLQFASYTFDNSLEEMFTTLQKGGCCCVPSEEQRMNNLAGAVAELDANFMDLTPTVASFISPEDVPSIKSMALGGEALTKAVIETWGPHVHLHGQYGPSEASINSAWKDFKHGGEPTNIGKATGSVSWVVDPSDRNRLVPIGCKGELLIEGPILSRGYLNDPEKTRLAFIDAPEWARTDGDSFNERRFYCTGDLVYYTSEGEMMYLGRKDSQVKLNGQRIELGEIEHHMKLILSSEAQSAVELVKFTDAKTTKALVGFLCLDVENDSSPIVSEMTESVRNIAKKLEVELANALPAYYVPSMFMPVTSMPMTTSGKLDRKFLRQIAQAVREDQIQAYRLAGKSGRAPSGHVEVTLARLWVSVLGLSEDAVGAEDSFFRLGGDSIGAMRLVGASRKEGLGLSVANIFSMPKLVDMAQSAIVVSTDQLTAESENDTVPFQLIPEAHRRHIIECAASECGVFPDALENIYPCTRLQEGLIALSTSNPGSYVAQIIYRLPPDTDISRFQKAWDSVIAAEAILRTRIVYIEDSGFLQVVTREGAEWHRLTDLQDISETHRHLPATPGGVLATYLIVEDGTSSPYFVWTAHHAVYDGYSMPNILSKVERAYRHPNEISLTTVPYSRMIKYLSSIEEKESDDFWLNTFQDISAPQFPQLPHPDYEVQASSQLLHQIPITRRSGMEITMPSMIRAAWGFMLATYSGSDDVLWGEINSGREVPVLGIEDIVGPTITTSPMRVKLDRQLTVSTYMQKIQRQASAALPFQFAGLQHIRKLSTDTALACDFQSLLAITAGDSMKDPEGGLWDVQSTGSVGTNFFNYALIFSCTVENDGIQVEAHYDSYVVESWLVERLLQQFGFILNRFNALKTSESTLGDFDLLNPGDQAIIASWNEKPVRIINKCIHEIIFEHQVVLRPSATAVEAWDIGTLTYRELDERATRLASHLISLGVKPQTFIPLFFEKSGWCIVAILAVLKCGAAFVPLDFEAPILRIREIVNDVEAQLILCAPQFESLCRSVPCNTLVVDASTERRDGNYHVVPKVESDTPAYVLFTSGSTGKPKGAVIHHHSFVSASAAYSPAWNITEKSRMLQFASYAFDCSLIEILSVLMQGGVCCVPGQKERTDDLVGVINGMRINYAALTPSLVRTLQPSQVPGLTNLTLVGEAMSQQDLNTWADRVSLGNGYGPTECSVVATFNNMSPTTKPNNLGKVITARGWVVAKDNHDVLAPLGAVGELIMEGGGVGAGYLHNPEKTAQAFISDVKWTVGADSLEKGKRRRFYKTGDLVKYNEDGTLLYLGRKDDQTKVRGQRLELSEVEHHIVSDSTVQNVLAAVPTSGPCAKRLVGVVSLQTVPSSESNEVLRLLPTDTASLNVVSIRDRICERLPSYMVPSLWIMISRFPLMPSGKMDRKRVIQWLDRMDGETYRTISTLGLEEAKEEADNAESKLQAIFAKVLNLAPEDIRLNLSFLHLGGDSISAMQVSSICRSNGLAISVRDIIRAKSITALASTVQVSDEEQASAQQLPDYDLPFELTPIQHVFFDSVGDVYNHFNQSAVLRLSRSFDFEEIKKAIFSLVTIHPMLRARYDKSASGMWRQRIEKDATTSCRVRQHRVSTANNAHMRPVVDESQATLNVTLGPTFSVDLFEIEDSFSQAIALVAHHLVVDVVSWGIILEDLAALLNGTTPPPQSLSFHTWGEQQATQARKDNAKNVFPLDNVPDADIGYWGMAKDLQNVNGDVITEEFELSPKDSMLLLGAHDALATEPLDVFLAAILESFRNVFPDRHPATIHNEGHGREPFDAKQDLSRTVGWFTTLTPIHLPVSSEDTTDIVSTIRWVKNLRERIPGKGRPYFAYRLAGEGHDFSSHWPAEVTFNYLGRMQALERKDALLQRLDGVTTSDIGEDVPRLSLIEITAVVAQGTIQFSFCYNRHIQRQAQIKRWILECRQTLVDAVDQLLQARPEPSLSDFKLLPLSYNGLSKLSAILPSDTTISDIEDIYPTSPMQQGLLLSQMKSPGLYAYECIFEICSTDHGSSINPRKLAEAWQVVVYRHPALRTVFIESLSDKGRMDQIVLKDRPGQIVWMADCNDEDMTRLLRQQPAIDYRGFNAPHRFTICRTKTGRIWAKLDMSHTICDGGSIPNLLNDLSRAYGGKLTRSDTGFLFSDFIAHNLLNSQESAVNYWKSFLSSAEPCLLPALHDGKPGPHEAVSYEAHIADTASIQAFCKTNGVTLSNVLQLTWALVLHYYVGTFDISFGVIASGRDIPVKNIEEAAGCFVNMLICRLNFTDDTPIRELLQKVQTDSTNARDYQGCSLAAVQHELQLPSFFNTVFTFQRRHISRDPEKTALLYENIEAADPSEYDLTLNVSDEGVDGITIDFGYWKDKVCDEQAHNMGDTFEKILSNIIATTDTRATVADLDPLPASGLEQIRDWNAELPPPVRRCVHDIVSEQALLRPRSAKAIEGWDGTFTYQEFDQVTNQLAAHLQSLGVCTGSYVPILFEKSSWAIVSMLAIMKAGAAYVPLDPRHPPTRLRQLIGDVGAKVVLCSRTHHALASQVATTASIVDKRAMKSLTLNGKQRPKSDVTPDHACYCLFTSGTTGTPKGTIIPHQAFCTSAAAFTPILHMDSTTRTFQFASYTFDASCVEILAALTVGGTICVPTEDERMSDLSGSIRRFKATWTLLTPSVLGSIKPEWVQCLRTLVVGGEATTPSVLAAWASKICFVEAYGPTETSIICATCAKSTLDKEIVDADPGTIGMATGCRTWVVHPKDHDKLMPVGGIGELVAEGHIVAQGYLGDEVKTAKAFIENPTWASTLSSNGSTISTARMYKTGDLVRYNSDGSLTYVSRKDTQIKLNGQRIELGEIEFHVKRSFPEGVQSAVELVAPMGRSAKALAVFFCVEGLQQIVAAETIQPTSTHLPAADNILIPMEEQLRDMCKAMENAVAGALPSYMIPSIFIPVSKMPWTAAGKLDRNHLKHLVQNLNKEAISVYRLSSASNKRKPTTETERKIQKLVCSTLNLPLSSVGIDDNFVRLGGDSIGAMKLATAAQVEHLSLSVVDIFKNPRLSDLAAKCAVIDKKAAVQKSIEPFDLLPQTLSRSQVLNELAEQCCISKDQVKDAYPASPLQEAFVTLSIRQPGAYVAQHILTLSKSVSLTKFKAAWEKAVAELDILRTRVAQLQSGTFLQAVLVTDPIAWDELTSLEEAKKEVPKVSQHLGGRLAAYALIPTSSDELYFAWTLHHSLYDGWSLPLILDRVQRIYQAGVSEVPKTPYTRFVKYLQESDTAASAKYWKRALGGAAPYQFPQPSHSTSTEAVQDGQLLQHTVKLAPHKHTDITPSTMIRAAWSLLVAAYSGSDDVVFGETLTGRDISVSGIADICGPTLTTVPSRVYVDRSLTTVELLKTIAEAAMDRIPHQHFSLSEIKRMNSDTATACDFQNLLVIQTGSDQPSESLWSFHDDETQSNFFTYPLVMECECTASRSSIKVSAHFNGNIISTWEVQRILFQLDSIITQLNTVSNVRDIRVFSKQDMELIQNWNARKPIAADETIHALFFEQAKSRPNATAVSAFDGEFTYAELRDLSSRLAQKLVEFGAGPEKLIPFCIDKSRWAIVAIMGILISGSGFVPLSPQHPVSRLEQIIGSCEASIIVCSPEYVERFDGYEVVTIDEKTIRQLPAPRSHIQPRAKSNNTAYVMFTSGSTGLPKGVVIEHGAFMASSVAMQKALNIDSSSRVFQFASFVFDVSMLEILTTLTCGAVVAVPSEQERTSDLAGAINRLKATFTCLTPSVANVLEGPSALPTLKTFASAAEPLTTETIDKWASGLHLMNAYGPTENSVLSMVNTNVSLQRDPISIGHPLESARAWLTEVDNPHRLAPVGTVAELCIEGPLLARCYLNNPAKTAEVFIENPAFLGTFSDKPHTRIYRTGDLVKYAPDGSVQYLGRIDNQIKLAGQRVELGEIEHHLQADRRVELAMVLMPKSGPGKRRLTAVVSFYNSSYTSATHNQPWNTPLAYPEVLRQIRDAKYRLSELVPPYMVPTVWLAVSSIPRLASAKLDKTAIGGWIENMDDETYRQLLNIESSSDPAVPASDGLKKLQEICARVLHVSVQDVPANQSWLSLGGDSLVGMHFLAQCRKESISITLNQLLRAKSLAQLAETVLPTAGVEHGEAQTNRTFELSPIQQLYFRNIGDATNTHFNQSFTLRLSRKVDAMTIKNAIDAVVLCHAMLRARFSRGKSGKWQQQVQGGLDGAYRFKIHDIATVANAIQIIANTQVTLNIVDGPVFAADLFNVQSGDQVLFLAAHHLVIDIVSWQIILADLEEHINSGTSLPKELPFQTWIEKQAAHAVEPAQVETIKKQSFDIEPANLAFWGMDNRSNVYGEIEHDSFIIDEELSAMALDDHSILRTDAVDYFVSAIIHSFSRVFINRKTPTIFNESHGREPWDNTDLSRSVAWFTSMYPIHISIAEDEDDVVQTVRQVKDLRRKIIENGRSYFAHRFLTDDGRQSFASHEPLEVLFNYLGKSQHINSDDSLFQPMRFSEDEEATISDLGAKTKRLALFEISASVAHGKINFDFMYNQNQKNQKGIRRWIAECQRTLEEIISTIAKIDKPQPTLSDFPLLPLDSYSRLDRVIKTFPSVGIVSYDQVEDVYPCAAMQEGMILSQIKDPSAYWSFATFEVKSKHHNINVRRVAEAWKKVVARHPALRTVFVDSVCKGGVFDQIVVKEPDPGLLIYSCEDAELTSKLQSVKHANHNGKRKPRLPHQFTIVQATSGRVFVKLEINHSVIDGGSWAILTKDLQDAYEGRLADSVGPPYSAYVQYLRSLPADAGIDYWKEQLRGVNPCYFPIIPQDGTKQRQLHSLFMDFDRFPEVQRLAEKSGVTFANILLATWALILRSYTSDANVCFGYLTSGRNVPIENVENAIGAFINMLCSRIKVSSSLSLLDVFQKVQNDFIDSLPHQHCSLAQFQHDLGLSGKALFNTAVSVQNYGAAAAEVHSTSDAGIELEHLDAHDPSEFAVTVSIDATRGDEAVKFAYWTDALSDDEAKSVSTLMSRILLQAISDVNMTIDELDAAIQGKPAGQVIDSTLLAPIRHTPRPTYRRNRTGSELSVRSMRSIRSIPRIEPPHIVTPAGSAPDWSSLIRSIVSEMVPQIVDQVLAKNKNAPLPTQFTVNEMSNQMTSMLARKASMSIRGRPSLDRKMSTASDAESRIGIAADMVAAAGVMATEALKGVPSDFVEKKLMTLWGELLDMVEESIEKDDSFFQLGGDSIIAMRLVGAAREEGLSMTVADVFRNPTFADMARVVRVAGEVIDQVMSQAGDGNSVTGKPSSSKPRIQLPERTASAWKDFESMVSEHAIADDTTDGGNSPPAKREERSEPVFKKWQGFSSSDTPSTTLPKERKTSLNQMHRLPTTIHEDPSPTQAPKSISLLGDESVISVISKVQVFKGGISDVLPVTDFQSLAITGSLLESRWMLNHFYLDGSGPLDIRKLKQAAFRVVQAFDILRTVFVPYGDRFLQVVLRKLQPEFLFQETDLDIDEFTAELRQKDREHGPRLGEAFVQFVVAKQKKTGQYRIFMRLSHAQYDGVCLPRVLESLQAGYNGLPVSNGPSFGTYVREIATAKTVAGAHDHWREVLRGSVVTQIVDRYGPNYQRSAGQTVTLKQTLAVPTLSYVNITVATVMKAAWAATLARVASKSDIVFGHVISGRNSTPSASAIVGPCLNMVPVRVVYRPEWTVLDLLSYIQDQQIANMPYESLGFREITRNCTDWPDWTNFSSVLQHNQSIIQSDDATFKLGGAEFRLGVVGTEEDFADFSIVSTSRGGDQVEVTLTYAPNSTITTEFAQHVFDLLCAKVITFSEDPYALLPFPSELSSGSSTTITSEVGGRKKSAEKAPLALPSNTGLTSAEITNLALLLRSVWSQILRPDATGAPVQIDLGTDFFENGGDIMGLAQVASILDQEGLRVRVEDLLSAPLFVEQVGLLAEERKKVIEKEKMSPWGEKGFKKEKEMKEEKERVGREAKLEKVESGLGKVLGKIRLRRRNSPKPGKA